MKSTKIRCLLNNIIIVFIYFVASVNASAIDFGANYFVKTNPPHIKESLDDDEGIFSLQAAYRNDTLFVSYFVKRDEVDDVFAIGTASLSINVNGTNFDLDKAVITKRGKWDAQLNSLAYKSMTLDKLSNTRLQLNIVPLFVGLGTVAPIQNELIAEIAVPILKCDVNIRITWAAPKVFTYFANKDITKDQEFIQSNVLRDCPCDADFDGLEKIYCTSSFLSMLKPKVAGGIFVGPGVKFNNGVWYFKAFDAGPGNHLIKHILPCKDTVSQLVTVQAAPCQSISGQDITLGFVPIPTPQGIFTDCLGQIFTTSFADQSVYKIDTFGTKQLIAGVLGVSGYQDGAAVTAKFAEPTGIAVSNTTGLIYVADSRNQVIRVINLSNNTVSTLSGVQGSLFGTANDDGVDGNSSKFSPKIIGITLDRSQTSLYVTESSSGVGDVNKFIHRIRKVNIITGATQTIAGGAYTSAVVVDADNATGTLAKFRSLSHISADEDYLYTADPSAKKIKKIRLTVPYAVTTVIGPAGLQKPVSASVSANGIIYVADQNDYTLLEINQFPTPTITIAAGVSGDNNDSPNTFVTPNASSVFVKGFIDIADFGSGKIKRVAIKDYGSKPFQTASRNYCYNGRTDTLAYINGIYSGAGISKINNLWIFNPIAAGVGKHAITYSYDLNNCNATFVDTFHVFPKPKPFKGIDQTICLDQFGSYPLDAGPGKSYQWYTGLPNQILTNQTKRLLSITATGIYSVLITDALGCIGGDTISINSYPNHTVNVGSDISLCAGLSAPLQFTTSSAYTSVLWQGGNTSLVDTAYGGGIYHVTITDINGCKATDTLNVISSLPPTPLITSDPVERCFANVRTRTKFEAENTFLTPQLQAMVRDKAGNTYVTDFENNLIRKIDNAGVQSIYAGQGTNPFGTTLATVRIRKPFGIAMDRDENIYFTEVSQNIIRKITPSGTVSIYAGVYGNTSGYNGDGRKDTIVLSQPTGITIDDIGNIYITEFQSHIVRKITPLGQTQTIGSPNMTGNNAGSFAQTRFNRPQAVKIDKAGYVYVADNNNTIKKINPFNRRVTVYTTIPAGSNVKGLTIDNLQRMYLSLNTSYTVYYVDPRDSTAVYHAGVFNSSGLNDGVMTTAKFEDLQGLYIDENGGALYAVDKNRIRIISDSCRVDLCEGYDATLTANIHTSYLWNNNPAQADRFIKVNKAGNYFVSVGNDKGCTFKDTISVYIIPQPIFTVTKDSTICVGDSISIQALLSPATANDTIQWFNNGKMIKQTIGLPLNKITVRAGMYSAVLKTGKLCTYTMVTKVDSIRPTLDAVVVGKDTLCQGFAVQLDVNVSTAQMPYKYKWTGEEIINDSIKNPSATPLLPLTNKYKVKVTDGRGCFNEDSVNVFIRPKPVISTIPDANICKGNSIILYTNVTEGKLPYLSQYWTPVTGLDNPNIDSPTATPTDSIVYTFNITDSDNCTSRKDVKIGVIEFEVGNATTNEDTLCPKFAAQLDVSVLKGSGQYTYSWTPVAGLSDSKIKNPIATPSITTEYTVTVTDMVTKCSTQKKIKISVIPLKVSLGDDIVSCFENGNQVLFPTVSGGSQPSKFAWTPVTLVSDAVSNTPTIVNLVLGINKIMVKVTDDSGCQAEDSLIITRYDRPKIKLSNDTLVCKGSVLTLSSQVTYPIKTEDNNPNIVWTNDSNSDANVTRNITITASDTTRYKALVTDKNGCSNVDSVKINVIKLMLNASSTANQVCPNIEVQLNAIANGGLGNVEYDWTPKNVLDNGAIANPKVILKTSSTLFVTAKDQLGCTAKDSVKIEVKNLSINAGADLTLCNNANTQLGASILGGTEPFVLKWLPQANLSSDQVLNPIFATNANGLYTYILNIEDKVGCKATDTVNINVVASPIADAGNDIDICFGNKSKLGGTPTATGGGGAPYKYLWRAINITSTVDDNTSANPELSSAGTGQYEVVVTDAAKCENRDTVNITVKQLPSINIAQDKPAACVGSSVKLTASSNVANPSFNWKKVPSEAIISGADNLTVVDNGNYKVIVKDITSTCSDSAIVTLNFASPPSNLSLTTASKTCSNEPVLLKAFSNGDSLTYVWTTDGKGTLNINALNNAQYNPNEILDVKAPNTINFKIVVSNLCGKDSTTVGVALSTVVKPSFKTDVKELLPGDNVNFYNISENPNNEVVLYTWEFGDGMKSKTFNSSHIYGESGDYIVNLIAESAVGCKDTASLPLNIIGNNTLYIPNAFSPSAQNNENKNIKLYGATISRNDFNWSIYNRWGEIVFNTADPDFAKSEGWNGKFKNDGEQLPLGVYTYTLNLTLADGRKIKRTGTISLIR